MMVEPRVAIKFLITGAAGFIGSNLALRLLERGDTVIGIDNHNDYYDPAIK
jgi:UDP-glucuronate 4-epimerase